MTAQEFKAWIEGFNNAVDGAPDAIQWKQILEKVGSIHDSGVGKVYRGYSPMWSTNPANCTGEVK